MRRSQEMLGQVDGSENGKEAGGYKRCSIHRIVAQPVSIRSET